MNDEEERDVSAPLTFCIVLVIILVHILQILFGVGFESNLFLVL